MRVDKLENGQTLKYRLLLGAIGAARRQRAPDVLRMLTYRPEFFGRNFGRTLHAAIRGESHFTKGERELMAAYTSHLNECLF